MKIFLMGEYMGGHTEIEFHSYDFVHKMGTFCSQIPTQITSLKIGEYFEIPDVFMHEELELSVGENPVQWYDEKDKIAWKIKDKSKQANEVNELFAKFMDVIAKYCNYDRKGAMEDRQRWADQFSI